MIDWTKPIRQKNGRAALAIGKREHTQGEHPWFVEIQISSDCWTVGTYTTDGRYINGNRPHEQDLENIPETITTAELLIPVIRQPNGCVEYGPPFFLRGDARDFWHHDHTFAILRVPPTTLEKGEGL